MTRRIVRAVFALLVAVAIAAVWISLEWLISQTWPALLLIAALWTAVIVIAARAVSRSVSEK
jgi:hypothetical protein